MVTEDLLDFVHQSLARGDSQEQITAALLGVGWRADEIKEAFPGEKPIHRKKLYIALAVLVLILIGGSVFVLVRKKSVPASQVSFKNTQLYTFGLDNFKFSFRYPNDYCVSQDIGSVMVLYKDDCMKTAAESSGDGIDVVTWPDTMGKSTTTNQFVAYLKTLGDIDTEDRREIAGYIAYKVKGKDGTLYAWAFATKDQWQDSSLQDIPGVPPAGYYWTVIISPHVENQPGGKEAQEIVINSFALGKDAEVSK